MSEKSVVVYDPQGDALALPEASMLRDKLRAIREFQAMAHAELQEGHDYGVIPGTVRPTLLKPGAEKIAKLLGLADSYEIVDKVEDWGKPLFRYLIRCRLTSITHQVVVSEGLGECNSMEAKYRWRDQKRACPECGKDTIIRGKREFGGGWLCFKKHGGCGAKWADGAKAIEGQPVGKVENEDIYSLVNTILKMAKKRALVDAALSAGRLSDVFTQDMEDLRPDSTPLEEAQMGGVAPPTGTTVSPPPAGQAPAQDETLPKTPSIPGAGPGATSPIPELKDFGELFQWAYNTWGLYRKDIEGVFTRHHKDMPSDPNQAAKLLWEWLGPPVEKP